MLPNIIAGIIIFLIVGGATAYIVKAKKSGKKCIGCPDSPSCESKCGGGCSACGCGCGARESAEK